MFNLKFESSKIKIYFVKSYEIYPLFKKEFPSQFLVWSDTDQTHRMPMVPGGEQEGRISSFGEHGQTV